MLRTLIKRSPLGLPLQRFLERRRQMGGTCEAQPEWSQMQHRLEAAGRVVDLGCGGVPHPAARFAVDAFLEPVQRDHGAGIRLRQAMFAERDVRFVQADLAALPFADKSFDFAYCSHVLEHVPDPKRVAAEMCRVAHAGAIVTPSIFTEIAFGRPYHVWLVAARGNRLVFIKKTPREDCAFGRHPEAAARGGYRATPETNPFDILLNDGGWYRGYERMPRLSRRLRDLWCSHSPVTKVVFLWEGTFEVSVIQEDGRLG